MKSRSELITQAVHSSCLIEIKAFKPGNVSLESDGHGMKAGDFIRSAELISPVMGMPDLSVGERILKSVQLTMSQVGCNTNLGIILLIAPMAQAAFAAEDGMGLQQTLSEVLKQLNVDDARLAFEAIQLASPGGLGEVEDHDVHQPATVTLLEAMQAAKDRDRIAWQYANDYQDVFFSGGSQLRAHLLRWRENKDRMAWATVACYLNFLASIPDSHVARKYGQAKAEEIMKGARPTMEKLQVSENPAVAMKVLQGYDKKLKDEGINPGTSADLTVASLVAMSLEALIE